MILRPNNHGFHGVLPPVPYSLFPSSYKIKEIFSTWLENEEIIDQRMGNAPKSSTFGELEFSDCKLYLSSPNMLLYNISEKLYIYI